MCGRLACGANVQDHVKFASLPQHFRNNDGLTSELLSELFQGYNRYCNLFKGIIPYLLANLVYHQPWHKTELHHTHPFRVSRLFQKFEANNGALYRRLKRELSTNLSWYDDETHMHATGIPDTVRHAHNIADLGKTQEHNFNSLKLAMHNELEVHKGMVESKLNEFGIIQSELNEVTIQGVEGSNIGNDGGLCMSLIHRLLGNQQKMQDTMITMYEELISLRNASNRGVLTVVGGNIPHQVVPDFEEMPINDVLRASNSSLYDMRGLPNGSISSVPPHWNVPTYLPEKLMGHVA